jgi:hypothetical protein
MVLADEVAFEKWYELVIRIEDSEMRREVIESAWVYALLYNTYERGLMRGVMTMEGDQDGSK